MDSTSTTLPIIIDSETGISLDSKQAAQIGGKLSKQYLEAEPFPLIILDDFLPDAFINNIYSNFPTNVNKADKVTHNNFSGLHKRRVSPYDSNSFCQSVFHFFNSPPFLLFLEKLTNIQGLIPDPYFTGGGFHEISSGGQLGIHTDFRINKKLLLERRLNVLIYLNQNWLDEYKGFLEIWDAYMKTKLHDISPIFNRCVIFNTGRGSNHGHPDFLDTPENVTRKSMALYYYTASSEIFKEVPSDGTKYYTRPTDGLNIKILTWKLRIPNYMKDFLPPILVRTVLRAKKRRSKLAKSEQLKTTDKKRRQKDK